MSAKKHAERDDSRVITPQELAQILTLSEREIVGFSRAGIFERKTQMHNKRLRVVYDWRDSVRRYILHLRKPREESRDDYAEEKRLTQRIVREQKELELRVAREEMVPVAFVIEVMTRAIAQAKNHIMGLPARLARQMLGLRDPNKSRTLLETGLRGALTEVSKISLHSFYKVGKNGAASNGNDAIKRVEKRVQRRRRQASL